MAQTGRTPAPPRPAAAWRTIEMCGRFTSQYTWRELHALYSLSDESFPVSNFEPRYNFAPMQTGPVIRLDRECHRELAMMRWGLVPSWSKDDKSAAAMINAKAETVAEKPAYRSAFKFRPCLVPADDFCERAKIGPKEKQPYFITTRAREPFALRGPMGTLAAERGAQRRAGARDAHDPDDRAEGL